MTPTPQAPSLPTYVLVTPARNEEKTLGETLQSVVAQTHLPQEWIVVSDGSTDGTDELVRDYARVHPFIRLLRLEKRPDRNFASVVFATEAGIAALETKDYAFLGLLDADVRFKPTYFADLIQRFLEQPKLGLAGGVAVDVINGQYHWHRYNPKNVAGAVHFFRRECFQAIAPLTAIPEGGWDAITNVQARAAGFDTQTFSDLIVDHLKPRNISQGGILRRKWQLGVRDYALGYDPLFALLRYASCVSEQPLGVAALMRAGGYFTSTISLKKRYLPRQIIELIRTEQRGRILRAAKPGAGLTPNA